MSPVDRAETPSFPAVDDMIPNLVDLQGREAKFVLDLGRRYPNWYHKLAKLPKEVIQPDKYMKGRYVLVLRGMDDRRLWIEDDKLVTEMRFDLPGFYWPDDPIERDLAHVISIITETPSKGKEPRRDTIPFNPFKHLQLLHDAFKLKIDEAAASVQRPPAQRSLPNLPIPLGTEAR